MGRWSVTFTADAYGEMAECERPAHQDGHHGPECHQLAPEPSADERDWCVYDVESDDEPVAQKMTRRWAEIITESLNLRDAALVVIRKDEEADEWTSTNG